MLTGNQSENVPGTNLIDSRCIVDFRPNDDWVGEYGFDWFRRGDTEEIINGTIAASRYTSIVGKYDDSGELKNTIDNTNYIYKLANEEYPSSFKVVGFSKRTTYLVPYISLYYKSINKWDEHQKPRLPNTMLYQKDGKNYKHDFCKTEAIVKVIINAKNIEKIEFNCGKSLTVEPMVITGISNGNSVKRIKIRLNYKFSEGHQAIKVIAHHRDGVTITFAGQVNVIKCEPRTLDLCLIPIFTRFNSGISKPGKINIRHEINCVQKFLSQAQIIPNISIYRFPQENDVLRSLHRILDKYKRNHGGLYYIDTYQNNSRIMDDLENLFFQVHEKKSPLYNRQTDNRYKMFIINEKGVDGVEGEASGISDVTRNRYYKSAVIFNHSDDSTICHELMHCLGLQHSFTNENKHTFKKNSTSNLMDYSRDSFTTWRWQWERIRQFPFVQEIKIDQ